MGLAGHRDLPPLFHVHPELEVKSGDRPLNYKNLKGRPVFGAEVETNTSFPGDQWVFCRKHGWLACRDGSVGGAEWKSPLIRPDDEIPQEVSDIINSSNYDHRCGGHLHVIHPDWGGLPVNDAWDTLVEYWGWFFAILYPERIRCDYSRFRWLFSDSYGPIKKSNRDRRQKYNWLNIKTPHHMEVRVFPEVKTTERLVNRMRMLEILLGNFHEAKNPESAYQIAQDVVVPAMQEVGAFKKWPRRDQVQMAIEQGDGHVFFPHQLTSPSQSLLDLWGQQKKTRKKSAEKTKKDQDWWNPWEQMMREEDRRMSRAQPGGGATTPPASGPTVWENTNSAEIQWRPVRYTVEQFVGQDGMIHYRTVSHHPPAPTVAQVQQAMPATPPVDGIPTPESGQI